jgi:hypothetical protein
VATAVIGKFRSDRSLPARIEQDLIDGSATTTAILNKCILLDAPSGSQELRV